MPELPEVETVKRTLAPAIGQTIIRVSTSDKKLRRDVPASTLRKTCKGATLTEVRRYGKYILIDLGDRPQGLLIHLGMSGRLRLMDNKEPVVKHTHAQWRLSNGVDLRFSDPRRFGSIELFDANNEKSHPSLAHMGPDPLIQGIDDALFYQAIHKSKRSIKTIILDQRVLAGVGNIYASEALWRAKVSPLMPGTDLNKKQCRSIGKGLIESFEHALTNGGTSLKDFVSADGKEGGHAHYLWVYGREGHPCRRCETPIQKQTIAARASYFCPKCQKTTKE